LPGALLVECDTRRIEQVITSLLSNAMKNTPPGGTVSTSAGTNVDSTWIKIEDNGVGLTSDEIPLLFTKFGKIDRSGMNVDVDLQGSGMGLYLARRIIELHGGTIEARSPGRDQGATFPIHLKMAGSNSVH